MALMVCYRRQHVQWYPSHFPLTLVVSHPWKSSNVLLHTKMARFSLIFSGKKHSDAITWWKSKVRSWIWCFLSFRFRWYPFRNRYRSATTRGKDLLKVVKSLQFCHVLKTTRWLKRDKCLQKSRMWPGILREAGGVSEWVITGLQINKNSKPCVERRNLQTNFFHWIRPAPSSHQKGTVIIVRLFFWL